MRVLQDSSAATASQGLAAVALAALSQCATASTPPRDEAAPPLTLVPSLLLLAAEAELGGQETVLADLWGRVAVALADRAKAPAAAGVALAAVREVAAAGHLTLASASASAALETVLTEAQTLAVGAGSGVVVGSAPDMVSGTEAAVGAAMLRGRALEVLSVVDWARGREGARRQGMGAVPGVNIGRENRDPVLAFLEAECAVRALVDASSDELEITLTMLEREAGQQRSSDPEVAATPRNKYSPLQRRSLVALASL